MVYALWRVQSAADYARNTGANLFSWDCVKIKKFEYLTTVSSQIWDEAPWMLPPDVTCIRLSTSFQNLKVSGHNKGQVGNLYDVWIKSELERVGKSTATKQKTNSNHRPVNNKGLLQHRKIHNTARLVAGNFCQNLFYKTRVSMSWTSTQRRTTCTSFVFTSKCLIILKENLNIINTFTVNIFFTKILHIVGILFKLKH